MNKDNSQIALLNAKKSLVEGRENCPNCGSVNLSRGAGLKPGQMSLKCRECNIHGQFAKSPENKSEIHGKSSRASNSSVSLQKTPNLQRFTRKQNPQISSIPGICPKDRHRYQVTHETELLGDRLTIDQAILLANQSTHL